MRLSLNRMVLSVISMTVLICQTGLAVYFVLIGIAVPAIAGAFDILQPLPENIPDPTDNRTNPAKVSLGQQLFFDPRLSLDKSYTCNSCHNVMASAGDGRLMKSRIDRSSERTAPTLWNVALQTVLFWDGRATSLEQALTEHILAADIMAIPDEELLINRLSAIWVYQADFDNAFGANMHTIEHASQISMENISRAIASYIRILVTPDSRFDQYIRGNSEILTASEKRGLQLFNDVGCLACHFGPNFSGPVPGPALKMGDGFYELFPNHLGSDYERRYKLADDLGRFLVTGEASDRHMWRVPGLRNIAVTAPYFHNGSVDNLEEAVRVMAKTQLKMTLGQSETDDIVAFLNTLTGEFPLQVMPRLPLQANH